MPRITARKTTNGKPVQNAGYVVRKSNARSRVSNGRDILPGTDGRSVIARRYHDIASALLADQNGPGACSEARLQLIRRFAAAAVMAEQMEAELANGQQIDIAEHAQLVSSMVRITRQLGINRVAKDVTPTIDAYLAAAE